MSLTIDLNGDVGEGFGPYRFGHDSALLQVITSANIACGFHAGDPTTMRRTVQAARDANVAIGAHPGLPDRLGFGRRNWDISPEDAYDLVVYQIGALWGIARAEGTVLHHVKPHGALYNMAATDPALAAAVTRAILHVDRQLILYALAGSELVAAGLAAGLQVAREAFSDRSYEEDGTLTDRSLPSAVLVDSRLAIAQVLELVRNSRVITRTGTELPLQADTLCIHGDRLDAAEFAVQIRRACDEAGIRVSSPASRAV